MSDRNDSLPGSEGWKDLGGKNAPNMGAKMSPRYRRYIPHSQHWKEKRASAIEQATDANGEKHCQRCGHKCAVLEVHHLTYERFTRELPKDLIALCPTCHEKADAERAAAWQKQLARLKAEANWAYEEAGFNGWLRKVKRIDPDDVGDDADWLWEEYDEWCRARDGYDRE